MSGIWKADNYTPVLDVSARGDVQAHSVAGLGARFTAWVVDAIVKLPFQLAAAWAVNRELVAQPMSIRAAAALAAAGGIAFLYYMLFEQVLGQTPGKNACDLRVLSSSGGRPTFRQVVLRNALRIVDWLPCYYALGAWRLWTCDSNQRLGDHAASTLVVYDDPLRELLSGAKVPASVYSTSEDGYLLETFLGRQVALREEVALPLARQLAGYFYRHYPPVDANLIALYSRGDFAAYLARLYYQEHDEPVGAGEKPPPDAAAVTY